MGRKWIESGVRLGRESGYRVWGATKDLADIEWGETGERFDRECGERLGRWWI